MLLNEAHKITLPELQKSFRNTRLKFNFLLAASIAIGILFSFVFSSSKELEGTKFLFGGFFIGTITCIANTFRQHLKLHIIKEQICSRFN